MFDFAESDTMVDEQSPPQQQQPRNAILSLLDTLQSSPASSASNGDQQQIGSQRSDGPFSSLIQSISATPGYHEAATQFELPRFVAQHAQTTTANDLQQPGWQYLGSGNRPGLSTVPQAEMPINPSRYYNTDSDWPAVRDAIRQQFPDITDDELQSQQIKYAEQRRGAFQSQYLNRWVQHYTETGLGGGATLQYWREKYPLTGGVNRTNRLADAMEAASKIKAGGATQRDYQELAQALVYARQEGNRDFLQQVGDVIASIPGFAVEFAATGGAFEGVQAGVRSGLTRAVTAGLGEAALSGAGRAAVAGRAGIAAAGYVAGAEAQNLLLPQMAARWAADRSFQQMLANNMQVLPGNDILSNLPAGHLDSFIEVFSERAGAAPGAVAGWLNRFPAVTALTAGIAERWAASAAGRTVAQFTRKIASTEGQREVAHWLAHQYAYHGIIGEMFEERVGEVLRGAAGLTVDANGNRDYGATGDLFGGRFGEAARQLATEGLSFAIWGAGHHAAARAVDALLPGGMTGQQQQPGPAQQQQQLIPIPPGTSAEDAARITELNNAMAGGGAADAVTAPALESALESLSQWGMANSPTGAQYIEHARLLGLDPSQNDIAAQAEAYDVASRRGTTATQLDEFGPPSGATAFRQQVTPSEYPIYGSGSPGSQNAASAFRQTQPSTPVQVPADISPASQATQQPAAAVQSRPAQSGAVVLPGFQVQKQEGGNYAVIRARNGEDVGGIKLGIIGGDNAAAKRVFPGVVKEGEQVARIHGVEIDAQYRGMGMGQRLYLEAMAQHGSDWYYNSQTYEPATNVLKAMAEKGLIELHWEPITRSAGMPKYGEKGGIHLLRLTDKGRQVAARGTPTAASANMAGQAPAVGSQNAAETTREQPELTPVKVEALARQFLLNKGWTERRLSNLEGDVRQLGSTAAVESFGWSSPPVKAYAKLVASRLFGQSEVATQVAKEAKADRARGAPREPSLAIKTIIDQRTAEERAKKIAKGEMPADRRGDLFDAIEGDTQAYQPPGAPLIPVQSASTPELVGAEPISNHAIITRISRTFDVPMHLGRIAQQTAGSYNRLGEHIRVSGRFAGDIAVVAHEAAHHLDKTESVVAGAPANVRDALGTMDYDQEKQRDFEGFAELLRVEMTGGTRPSVPAVVRQWFDQWKADHPEWSQKIADVRRMVDQWANQGAAGRVAGQMSKTREQARPAEETTMERSREYLARAADKFYEQWVDRFWRVRKVEREAAAKGAPFAPGAGPHELIMALQGKASDMAGQAMNNGVWTVRPDGSVATIGPAFAEVFAGLEGEQSQQLVEWAYARHALDEWTAGRNPGITRADAQAIIDTVGADAAKQAQFTAAADKWTQYLNALNRMLVDAGVLTEAEVEAWEEKFKNYLPLLRVRPDSVKGLRKGGKAGQFVDVPDIIKARHGSDLQIWDPVIATVWKTLTAYNRMSQQQISNSLVQVAKMEGMGRWVAREPAPFHIVEKAMQAVWPQIVKNMEAAGIDMSIFEDMDEAPAGILKWAQVDSWYHGDQPVVRVIENGKPAFYRLNKDLYAVAKGLNSTPFEGPIGPLLRVLSYGTAGVKLGATVLNPAFVALNIVRDAQTFLFTGKNVGEGAQFYKPFEWMGKYAVAMARAAAGGEINPIIQLYEMMGGKQQAQLRHGSEAMQTTRRSIVSTPTAADVSKKIVTSAYNGVIATLGIGEAGPRLSEFEAVLNRHGITQQQLQDARAAGSDWIPPWPVLIEAINAAGDVTVNFGRAGSIGRAFNQFIPYFNPPIQGIDKFIRNFKDHPVRSIFATAALLALTTTYWLRNREKDHYKEVDDRTRFAYWIVYGEDGKPIAYVPRSQEFGAWIVASWESFLRSWEQNNPQAAVAWAKQAAQSIVNLRVVGWPIVEAGFNYDTFRGRPIVNEHDAATLQPRDQYNPTTQAPYRAIGDALNVSPARIQHVAEGSTGGLATGRGLRVPFVPQGERSGTLEQFYAAEHEAAQLLGSAHARGREVSQADADRAHELTRLATLMTAIRHSFRDITDSNARFELEKYAIGLARFGTNQPDLARYPNPLTADPDSLPAPIREAVDHFLRTVVTQSVSPRPVRQVGENAEHYSQRVEEWERRRREASGMLDRLNIPQARLQLLRRRYGFAPR